ncbi:Gti1/Pac2 family-domain-containing protein [Catenaria anguillulae PL171]|uniref:Gti1/Pac2 family-domain-containing protein n=1 Tax=Catenaria anguillulae PL171 TaxID=765915 RepID=A0A1Y2HPT2_9FUNG|nr:Gti1/Pac2 family-domain-containing protein [Catenaria anguillulae PL171]
METWFGIIRSLDDALRLVEAARTGILPRVTRRLTDDERATLIRSGSVFIFEETEAQVRRWADSRLWSSSRMKGHFLLYTQLAHDPAGSSPTSTTGPTTRRPSDTSVSTTTSSPSLLDDKHVTPPPAPAPVPAPGTIGTSGDYDGDDDVFSSEGATAAGSNQAAAAGVGGAPTRTVFKKRALSLSTAFGQKLRLISYYAESDATAGALPTIDSDDRLANLPVPENLYYAANDTPVALSRRSATRLPTISGPVLAPQAASMPPSMVPGHGFYTAAAHDHQSHHPPYQQHGQAQALAQPQPHPQQQQRQLPAPIAVGTASAPASRQYHQSHNHVPTGQQYHSAQPPPSQQPHGPSPTNSYPPPHLHSASQQYHHPPYPATHPYSTSPPPPPGPPGSLLITSPRRPSYSPTRAHSHPYARPSMASPEHRQASTFPPVTAVPSSSSSSTGRQSWTHLDSPPPGILPHPSSTSASASMAHGTRSRSGSASSMINPHFQSMSLLPSPTSASVPAARSYPPPTDGPLVLPPIRTLSPSLESAPVPAGQGLPETAQDTRDGMARAHPDMRYAGLATSEDKRQLRALDAWSSEKKW